MMVENKNLIEALGDKVKEFLEKVEVKVKKWKIGGKWFSKLEDLFGRLIFE